MFNHEEMVEISNRYLGYLGDKIPHWEYLYFKGDSLSQSIKDKCKNEFEILNQWKIQFFDNALFNEPKEIPEIMTAILLPASEICMNEEIESFKCKDGAEYFKGFNVYSNKRFEIKAINHPMFDYFIETVNIDFSLLLKKEWLKDIKTIQDISKIPENSIVNIINRETNIQNLRFVNAIENNVMKTLNHEVVELWKPEDYKFEIIRWGN